MQSKLECKTLLNLVNTLFTELDDLIQLVGEEERRGEERRRRVEERAKRAMKSRESAHYY